MTLTNPLTTEETRALTLAAHGYTDAVAAHHHHTCARTYRRHLAAAATKLGVRSRIHAVAIAASRSIITVTPGGQR